MSDQEKKMSVDEKINAVHIGYYLENPDRLEKLRELVAIVRADQTRIVLERFKAMAKEWNSYRNTTEREDLIMEDFDILIQTIEKGQKK